MLRHLGRLLASGVLAAGVATSLVMAPAQAQPRSGEAVGRATVPVVTLTVPRSATEGERVALAVRVGAPKRAVKVQLWKRTRDLYGVNHWTAVRSRKVVTGQVSFAVVATDENAEWYRASVVYRNLAKPVTTTSSRITVWRWVPLSGFSSYYSTYGTSASQYTQFRMNGTVYAGWSTYGSYPTWESRYTLGRHCKSFRTSAGVLDDSADGSSAEITLTSDGTSLDYTSGVLAPGAVNQVRIPLGNPYRIAIQGRNASAGILAHPALGDPEFLCTNL